ncbi:hypothetical protein [Streptomyces sp. NPDC101150]|uniref:hypothetical protein n=1 Tax=Streptomyces sp. NPDC101150 TaxID=3366114 RepID=UPI003830753D
MKRVPLFLGKLFARDGEIEIDPGGVSSQCAGTKNAHRPNLQRTTSGTLHRAAAISAAWRSLPSAITRRPDTGTRRRRTHDLRQLTDYRPANTR